MIMISALSYYLYWYISCSHDLPLQADVENTEGEQSVAPKGFHTEQPLHSSMVSHIVDALFGR